MAENNGVISEEKQKTPKKRGEKGEGSIYPVTREGKNGPIVYHAASYKAPNMPKKKTRYGKTEAEARKLLKEMKIDAIKNSTIEIKKISVKEYMENWLNNIMRHEWKPLSYDIKESILKNHVLPHIGELQIASLKPENVQNMVNSMVAKGKSYSTIRKAYDCVNACFKLGIEKKEVADNPCAGVKLPKNIKKKVSDIEFFVDFEIERICNASIQKYKNGIPIYRLGHSIILLMYTGLRISELLALEWKDINFEKKSIFVRKSVALVKNREDDAEEKYVLMFQNSTKTDSSDRLVPLNMKAINALEELKKLNGDSKYVMATQTGEIASRRNIDRMFRSILKRCGLEETGVHTLRHTFASMLFKNGVDAKTVSEILGHSNVSITYNIYIHIIKEQKFNAVELLDKL